MKLVLLALIVFMSIGVTLSANLLDQFDIEKNYLLVGLGAFVITGLLAFRDMALIVIILFMSLAINMPEEVLAQYYLDKDLLIAAIILMVTFPWFTGDLLGEKAYLFQLFSEFDQCSRVALNSRSGQRSLVSSRFTLVGAR